MRSVPAVLVGAWVALLVSPPLLTGCANILGLDDYRPEPDRGGGDPGGDPLGSPCESGDTCASTFCSNKVCCDQVCDAACTACDMVNLEGTCRPRAAGTTFVGCDGVCDGDGGCLVEGGTAELVGGAGDQRAHAVAARDGGGFAIAGQFDLPFTFGPAPMTAFGANDAYVATFDEGGELGFERSFGGPDFDTFFAVDIAPDGWVVAGGESRSNPVNFAGMPYSFTAAGDPIVVAWDSSGTERWLRVPSQSNAVAEVTYGVGFDDEGRIWAAGLMADPDNLGRTDGFVNVYDTTGMDAFPPIRLGTDGSSSDVRTLAVDRERGRVLVAGTTDGPLGFAAVSESGLGPDPDMFLIMFDSTGPPRWGHVYTSLTGGAVPVSAAFDDDGGVAVVGIARGSNDFGGPTLEASVMDDDIFVASFTEDGVHRFSRVYPAVGLQVGRSVAFDASGRLVVAGEMYGAFEFGPEAPLLGVVGASDAYVGRLSHEGQHLASLSFGDVADQQIWGVTTTDDGLVRLVGFAGGMFEVFETPVTSPDGTNEILLMALPP